MTQRDNAEHENPPPTVRNMEGTSMYTPTIHDIRWAYTMLVILSEGGVLQYASIPLSYRVSHTNRTLTLLNPELLSTPRGMLTHLRTIAVYKPTGYTVVECSNDVVTAVHQFEFHTDTCKECDREAGDVCPVGENLLYIFYRALVASCNDERSKS